MIWYSYTTFRPWHKHQYLKFSNLLQLLPVGCEIVLDKKNWKEMASWDKISSSCSSSTSSSAMVSKWGGCETFLCGITGAGANST